MRLVKIRRKSVAYEKSLSRSNEIQYFYVWCFHISRFVASEKCEMFAAIHNISPAFLMTLDCVNRLQLWWLIKSFNSWQIIHKIKLTDGWRAEWGSWITAATESERDFSSHSTRFDAISPPSISLILFCAEFFQLPNSTRNLSQRHFHSLTWIWELSKAMFTMRGMSKRRKVFLEYLKCGFI